MTLHDLVSVARGNEVWVLAGGPSMDIVDLRKVPPDRAIGCNRILRSGFCPKYLVFVDLDVWKQERERMLAATGTILITSNPLYNQIRLQLPLDRTICFTTSQRAIGSVAGPLFHGLLTGYYASEIATRMVFPFGKVYLCGMDLQWPEETDETSGDGKLRTHAKFIEGSDGRKCGCTCGEAFRVGAQSLARLRDAFAGRVRFLVVGDSVLRTDTYFFQGVDTFP